MTCCERNDLTAFWKWDNGRGVPSSGLSFMSMDGPDFLLDPGLGRGALPLSVLLVAMAGAAAWTAGGGKPVRSALPWRAEAVVRRNMVDGELNLSATA